MALIALTVSIGPAHRQWQTDPRGFWKTVGYFFLYWLYIGVGLAILFLLVPRGPTNDTGVTMTIFILLWIAYGGLWLYRLVPNYKNTPDKPLKRVGLVDVLILGTLVTAFSTAL